MRHREDGRSCSGRTPWTARTRRWPAWTESEQAFHRVPLPRTVSAVP